MKGTSIKMTLPISPDDPALELWNRVSPEDLAKIADLFDHIPVQVGKVAERLGIEVLSVTLSSDISGLIRRNEDGSYQIKVNNTDLPVRQRFTVCHEISHYLLHRSLIDSEGITDNILYRSQLSNKEEIEANKLAAALLIPWKKVFEWHQTNYGSPPNKINIDEISSAFRASRLSVGFRLGI